LAWKESQTKLELKNVIKYTKKSYLLSNVKEIKKNIEWPKTQKHPKEKVSKRLAEMSKWLISE
jgi:hypothetical protein